jgi:hypothetical protein
MTLVVARLEALVVARAHALVAGQSLGELMKPLARFSPAELTPAAWHDRLAEIVAGLHAQGVLDEGHRVGDAGELGRRIGRVSAPSWAELSDRVLPGLALGIAADDAKLRARIDGRDGWAAAIAGRMLGLWTSGPPPSLPAVCDALVWREHGLPGKPKRCPPELRAVYVERHLGSPAGSAERGVRLLAARAAGAPRPELRALRDALVRGWLAGRVLGPASPDAAASSFAASFAGDVRRAAGATSEGWFGDRKVFVSAVWNQLRRDPRWAELALPEFKARLVAAHKAGELELARADLVAAMDPALVAASEIAADGASFHFLVQEASAEKEPAS